MRRIIFLSLLSFCAQAEVYRCKNANGQTVFQKSPCPGQIDAKPMDLKQPSEERLQKMRVEEKLRDIQYLQLKMKERELALREQQAANQAARVDALNRIIANGEAARQEAYARSDAINAAWDEYRACRERERAGHIGPRNRCVMP